MRSVKDIKKMLKIIFPEMKKCSEIGYGANENPIYLVWEGEQYYIVTELNCGIRLVHQGLYNGDYHGTKRLLKSMIDVVSGCTEYKALAADPCDLK